MKKLDELVLANADNLIKVVQESVRIPSICSEPTSQHPYGEEIANALDHALNVAQSMGFRTTNLNGKVAWAEYGDGEKIVGAMGHLDVVPPGENWSFDPFCGDIVDNHIRGRGTQDDKGPLFSSLFALKALADSHAPLKYRVRIIFGLDEESGQMRDVATYLDSEGPLLMGYTPDGEYPVVNAEKGALKFTGYCSFNNLLPGKIELVSYKGGEGTGSVPAKAKATLSGAKEDLEKASTLLTKEATKNNWPFSLNWEGPLLSFSVTGKAAHATLPGLGVNAIGRLCTLLSLLDIAENYRRFFSFIGENFAFCPDLSTLELAASHPHTGNITCNLATLEGDRDSASFYVGIYIPAQTLSFDDVCSKIAAACLDEHIDLDIKTKIPPLYVSPDNRLIKALSRGYENATGEKSRLLAMCGSTYSKKMPNMVPFGGTFNGEPDFAHGADERVLIDRLLRSTCIMAHALKELAND